MITEKEFWDFAGRYFRTLTSIQTIVDGLQVGSVVSKDVRALKSMKRIENIMNDFGRPEGQSINEGCAGCCNMVATDLQKELDACHLVIKNFKILETRETDRLHKIIEELKDRNIEDLKELYDFHEGEQMKIGKDKMEAIKCLLECDCIWALHTDEGGYFTLDKIDKVVEDLSNSVGFIDELKETIRLERIDHTAERSVLNQKYHDDLHEKDATIKYLKKTANEVIACLRMQVDDLEIKLVGNRKLVDDLKAELSARKEDSEVLEKIHTLIDEWSIHKNGGHQSFSILHKIDDLLASNLLSVPEDTTIDEEPEISVTFAYMELP